ncbi:MAG: hypothetical protein P4L22_03875 [Candidatus Babeliales bacterium]|nr:hypothetical protein [Candidatus Babeliales bacterium]
MIKKCFLNLLIACLVFGYMPQAKPNPSTPGLLFFFFVGPLIPGIFLGGLLGGCIIGSQSLMESKSDEHFIDNADDNLVKCLNFKEQVDALRLNNKSALQEKIDLLLQSLDKNSVNSQGQFKNYLCSLKGLIFDLKNNRKILSNKKNKSEVKSWLARNEGDLNNSLSRLQELYKFLNFNKKIILKKLTI